jgi:hypothetical protein
MTTITMTGNRELAAALRAMGERIPQSVDDVVMEVAAELEADIKLRIQSGPKTGKIYTRGSVTHQASAPGQAPATDTGGLIGSIQHERDGFAKASVLSRLMTSVYLELGTRHIAPRPAWVPAAEGLRPEYTKRLEAAISGVIR